MSAGLHVLGPVDQIPVGEGRAYGVAGEQIAVFRLRDGSFRAVSAVCPHKGGPIADGTIDCPCHGSKFNLDGTVAKGPASRPLEPKSIAVKGTSIVLA